MTPLRIAYVGGRRRDPGSDGAASPARAEAATRPNPNDAGTGRACPAPSCTIPRVTVRNIPYKVPGSEPPKIPWDTPCTNSGTAAICLRREDAPDHAVAHRKKQPAPFKLARLSPEADPPENISVGGIQFPYNNFTRF